MTVAEGAGYGDIAPETPLGQSLASVIRLLGYAIVAVPTRQRDRPEAWRRVR